jgi:hypothetical protein
MSVQREYRNMGKSECERAGKIWVEAHYRSNTWIHAHCRDRAYEEINKMSPEEKKKFEKLSPNLSGQWEGNGPDPLEAVSEILRGMDLPYNGGGEDFEFTNLDGDTISDEDWEKNGGNFSTNVYKNGRTYSVSGSVHEERRGWIAGAEVEEIEVD